MALDKVAIEMAKEFVRQAKVVSAEAQEVIDEMKARENKYRERREQYRRSSRS
jgi:ABC-type Fe3+-hydroxamate transport system substrate-binding protein